MEPATPIPSPVWGGNLDIGFADRVLGLRVLLRCDHPEVVPLSPSEPMSYTKISNGGLLMTLIPGLRTKLYLGTDHLLLIEQLVLVERYKRFYFRDIQVITATKSARWVVFGALWALLALLAALSFFIHHPVVLTLGTVLTALFGFAFLHNMILGPTCIVRLQTAVQTHRIAPLERIRDFRKGMEIIEPLIRNAQLADAPRSHPKN
jgi:hypothetical protein